MRTFMFLTALLMPLGAFAQAPTVQPPPSLKKETGAPEPKKTPEKPALPSDNKAQKKEEKPTHFITKSSVLIANDKDIKLYLYDLEKDKTLPASASDVLVLKGKMKKDIVKNVPAVRLNVTGATNEKTGASKDFDNPYFSIVEVKDNMLKENSKIPVYGDREALLKALKTLLAEEKKTPDEKEKTEKKPAQSSSAVPMSQATTGKSENVKTSITPLPLNEDKVTVGSQPCDPRIDLAGGQVFPQSSITKSVNGGTATVGQCQDSGLPFQIQYTYAECTDELDVPSGKAWARRKAYYVENGNQKFINECTKDPEYEFALTENAASCSPIPDYAKGVMRETVKLQYTNRSGQTISVTECQASKENPKTWDIVETADGCSVLPDFTASVAYQQTRKVYDKDGILTPISACFNSAETYPIIEDVCRYEVVNGEAVKYASLKATTPQGVVSFTDCQPMAAQGLIETTEGCTDLHFDYFEAATSRGASRFYYLNDEKKKIFATECKESQTTYPHQFVVSGYDHKPVVRKSTQELEIYIDLPSPTGRTLIAGAEVRPQSATLDWVYQSLEKDVLTEDFSYEGCKRYYALADRTVFKLPDGTLYNEDSPNGHLSAGSDVCIDKKRTRRVHKAELKSACGGSIVVPVTYSQCARTSGFCTVKGSMTSSSKVLIMSRFTEEEDYRLNPYTGEGIGKNNWSLLYNAGSCLSGGDARTLPPQCPTSGGYCTDVEYLPIQ